MELVKEVVKTHTVGWFQTPPPPPPNPPLPLDPPLAGTLEKAVFVSGVFANPVTHPITIKMIITRTLTSTQLGP